MLLLVLPAILLACSVSYKFNGASINYDKVKTISIADFPIKSTYVYQPLANKFNDDLKDIFTRQTRLQLVRSANADLQIEGEITGINVYNEAVAADGYSSKAKVTITVNVRYVNNTNHQEDFEQQFSAFRSVPRPCKPLKRLDLNFKCLGEVHQLIGSSLGISSTASTNLF